MKLVAAFIALSFPVAADAASKSLPENLELGLGQILGKQAEQSPGWSWYGDTSKVHANLGGVIANALLDAYVAHKSPATWVTVQQYVHHLRESLPTLESESAPFKADIEFLARSQDLGVTKDGRQLAHELFAHLRGISANGRDEYRRIASGRARTPELIGYDIALSIRAALAVGERAYAEELASSAIADGHLRLRNARDSFEVTSVTALLHAVSLLRSGAYKGRMQRAAAQLVKAQGQNGSWAVNNTQATAYAVRSLSQIAGVPGAKQAAQVGRKWLLRAQFTSGEFPSFEDGWKSRAMAGPVIPLVEAEVLSALVATL